MAKAKQDYDRINHYARENYDRILLLVPKGSKARIVQAARNAGRTTSDFIVSMIPRTLIGRWKKKDADGW